MYANTFHQFVKELSELTHAQKVKLLRTLQNDVDANEVVSIIERLIEEVHHCPHCESDIFSNWGSAHGLQRYRCKSCNKTFNALTGTPLSRLRKKDQWIQFANCLLNGFSVRKSAAICDVDPTTAFRWRHRFLALPAEQKSEHLTGIVEDDEVFFRRSEKGSRNIQGRKPRKRGMKTKSNSELVPVFMALDRAGHEFDTVLPKLDKNLIQAELEHLIDQDALLCTDGSMLYKEFAKKHQITHKRIVSVKKQRVLEKVYHIQTLNNYAMRLK